jgi:hypothetical protein
MAHVHVRCECMTECRKRGAVRTAPPLRQRPLARPGPRRAPTGRVRNLGRPILAGAARRRCPAVAAGTGSSPGPARPRALRRAGG